MKLCRASVTLHVTQRQASDLREDSLQVWFAQCGRKCVCDCGVGRVLLGSLLIYPNSRIEACIEMFGRRAVSFCFAIGMGMEQTKYELFGLCLTCSSSYGDRGGTNLYEPRREGAGQFRMRKGRVQEIRARIQDVHSSAPIHCHTRP